jgi:two-component system sensor histidine kinase UhpB
VSLRLRLTLLLVALLVSGVLAIMGRGVDGARREVQSELAAIDFRMTQLLDLLFLDTPAHIHADDSDAFFRQLTLLESAPGFDVEVRSATRDYPEFNATTGSDLQAPAWFVRLLDIDEELLIQNLGEFNGDTIIIHTDATDELNGIWVETRLNTLMRLAGLSAFFFIVYAAIGHWLKPVNQIVHALDDIVQGDFSRRVPKMSMLELDQIARRINHLIGVLGASKADNARLTRQTLTAQEQERRYFAQELHDSLGQSVSAIKAMAVSIDLRSRGKDPVVAESARNIEKISEAAYASVRDMMAWLRPAVLDELGLTKALETMVDEWNMHHEDTFCRLRIDANIGDLLEVQKINVYRIVQEALTNTARHAAADMVNVVLGGKEVISLIISDNGKGFDAERIVMGMGLSGIRDRVNLLQGTLTVSSALGKGTSLYMEFPRVAGYRRRASDKVPA